MHVRLLLLGTLLYGSLYAQPAVYTTQQAHSHNDYKQTIPFRLAYNAVFGSIEADIYLSSDQQLLVAHTARELEVKRWRLDSLYLIPLVAAIRMNHGHVYADTLKRLQFMIDLKTAAIPTLKQLVETLGSYPELVSTPGLRITISGNRPEPSSFENYPAFITFDGELSREYPATAMTRISMLSASLKAYTSWNGAAPLEEPDLGKVKAEIEKAHRLGKPIRFWEAPDNPVAWNLLRQLRVDYINTDKIAGLSDFLEPRTSKDPN